MQIWCGGTSYFVFNQAEMTSFTNEGPQMLGVGLTLIPLCLYYYLSSPDKYPHLHALLVMRRMDKYRENSDPLGTAQIDQINKLRTAPLILGNQTNDLILRLSKCLCVLGVLHELFIYGDAIFPTFIGFPTF